MNIIRFPQFIALACLILLCSCATKNPILSKLPPETPFNKTIASGAPLFVTLTLETGEKLLFFVDTGCPDTVVDKSLEPKLGKRLGTKSMTWGFYDKRSVGIYRAPKIFLGGTQLLTGNRVKTENIGGEYDGIPIMGFLGMDCLRHYCMQLDFAACKMRFLDATGIKDRDWGKAYPLDMFFDCVFAYGDILDMEKVPFRVDTGLYGGVDFMLKPGPFQWEMREQKPFGQSGTNFILLPNGVNGTNRVNFADRPAPTALLSKVEFGGETYTNLVVLQDMSKFWPHENFIGLRFFSRNLVTFDFPNRVMYLKPESVGPSVDEK